jgi:hypothetical protein
MKRTSERLGVKIVGGLKEINTLWAEVSPCIQASKVAGCLWHKDSLRVSKRTRGPDLTRDIRDIKENTVFFGEKSLLVEPKNSQLLCKSSAKMAQN